MNKKDIMDTARTLVADDRDLLAMDKSNPPCNKRFAKLQRALLHRANCSRAARRGEYIAEMDRTCA